MTKTPTITDEHMARAKAVCREWIDGRAGPLFQALAAAFAKTEQDTVLRCAELLDPKLGQAILTIFDIKD